MHYNQSFPLKIVTLQDPEQIKLVSSSSKSLSIQWKPYSLAIKYVMSCRPIFGYNDSAAEVILDSNHQINSTNVQQNGDSGLTVLNLHPKTVYLFWLTFWFENRSDPYIWPRDKRFEFETNSDLPNAPDKPSIVQVRDDVFEVTWKPAEGNGAIIEEYSLEGIRYHGSNRASRSTNSSDKFNDALITKTLENNKLTVEEHPPIADAWKEYWSGHETYWIIKDLIGPIGEYSFRVRARNVHGWGKYSAVSERITQIPPLNGHSVNLLIAVAAPALVAILIVTFSCIACGEF